MRTFLTISLLAIFCGCGSSELRPVALIAEYDTPAIGENGILQESVGIETLGGVFTPLLEKGCSVPCEIVQVFSTAADDQDQIRIFLFRGNSAWVAESTPLGEYSIEGIYLQKRGEPQIEVRIAVENSNVTISADYESEGQSVTLIRVEVP